MIIQVGFDRYHRTRNSISLVRFSFHGMMIILVYLLVWWSKKYISCQKTIPLGYVFFRLTQFNPLSKFSVLFGLCVIDLLLYFEECQILKVQVCWFPELMWWIESCRFWVDCSACKVKIGVLMFCKLVVHSTCSGVKSSIVKWTINHLMDVKERMLSVNFFRFPVCHLITLCLYFTFFFLFLFLFFACAHAKFFLQNVS